MILADTSAWIEYDRASGSNVDRRMTELIAEESLLAITEPVLMEVLAGARTSEREADLRRLLLRFGLLPCDPVSDFESAATIYRRCRRRGITPRGLLDCLIAAIAWRRGATLLAYDADLDRVATVVGLEMDPASLRVQNPHE
jgi:predicted nucleic acid-binding protein